MRKILVVLDSNVIISSLLSSNGSSSRIIELWRKHYFDLLTSTYILSEVKKTLQDKQLANKYRFAKTKQSRLLTQLTHFATIIDSTKSIKIGRDQNDHAVLSATINGHANYLVTGDQDLLVLAHDKTIKPLKIVTPTDFLHLFIN